PDGPADGDDGFAGDRFGLRQAHRNFGHRLSDDAHVLREIEHVGEHEEKDDGHDNGAADRKHGGKAQFRRAEHRLRVDRIERGNADDSPDESGNAGGNIGAARRTGAARLRNLTNAGPVVIGGAAWRRIACLPSCLRSVVRKEVARFMGWWRVGEAGLRGTKGRTGSRFCWAYAEGFLDGGQRLFGRVFSFLRSIRHLGRLRPMPPDCRRGPNRQEIRGLCRKHGTEAAAEPPTSPIYRPALILSPWQHEKNHAGKDFFIIVNRLLTSASGLSLGAVPAHDAGRIEATLRLIAICEQALPPHLRRLNHRLLSLPCIYRDLIPIGPNSSPIKTVGRPRLRKPRSVHTSVQSPKRWMGR